MTLQEQGLMYKAKGEIVFTTPERPCKKGHIERYTRNGACVECYREKQRKAQKKYYKNNTEKVKTRCRIAQQTYRLTHPEKAKQANKKWKSKNEDKYKQYQSEYRQKKKITKANVNSQMELVNADI